MAELVADTAPDRGGGLARLRGAGVRGGPVPGAAVAAELVADLVPELVLELVADLVPELAAPSWWPTPRPIAAASSGRPRGGALSGRDEEGPLLPDALPLRNFISPIKRLTI